jgi:hypothetical protein
VSANPAIIEAAVSEKYFSTSEKQFIAIQAG